MVLRLGRYNGVGPIGSSTGKVDVAGRSWELFVGNNGQMKVFSFVAPSPVNTFTADVKLFFTYLQSRQNFPVKTQNLLGESTVSALLRTRFQRMMAEQMRQGK